MQKAHRHHEMEINFLFRGSVVYLMGGAMVRLEAGRLALFWAATPHQLVAVHEPGDFLYFTVPFAWVLQWQLAPGFIRSILNGDFRVDRAPQENDRFICQSWHDDLRSGNPERRKIALLEMEARLRRLVLHHPRRPASHPASDLPAGGKPVQTMVRAISLQYTGKLPIREIIRPTGLNESYAMTLFRRQCGMSIGEYLIRQRLLHARRLLVTTGDKIVDIAYASGFQSSSRFYEAYRKYYGGSPGELRRGKGDTGTHP